MTSDASVEVSDPSRATERAEENAATAIEIAPLEFLLNEARERYRSEHEKFNQTYTRAGIYLAAVAVYANVLAKFIDRAPTPSHSWVLVFFHCSIGGLLLTVVGSAACVIGAILGRPFGFVPEPSSWIEFLDNELRPFMIESGQYSEEGTSLAVELRRQTLERYASAIDINVRVNRTRSAWLHRCGYFVLVGLILAAWAAGSYLWLSFSPQP